ncbi:MAG: hypothetical protein MJ070_03135 [Lachnospiraceae bacterium]|nr:hypothetical protein [Lachnospiraceae bacterium]
MKKFTINAEMCRKPIVNMASGSVIASSFTPHYNKDTLTLEYISLALKDGDILTVPFSALCFSNDVCTMVLVPETPFVPGKGRTSNLLGTPLSAVVGEYTLFTFGTIEATDVDENGSVISLLMADGKTYPIT